MAEYIERVAVEENESICRKCFHSYVCEQFNEHRDRDNKKCHFFNDHFVPTADVAEVRHGEWYRHDKKKHGDTCYYCSVCEKMALADCMVWELTDYCPNCGAKMDGKGEGE